MTNSEQNLLTIQDRFLQVYPHKDVDKRTGKGGYIQLKLPSHPMSHSGWVLEHRAVFEEKLGRFLYPCEQIHHIDKNRQNNNHINLKLYATQQDHLHYEHSQGIFGNEQVVNAVLKAASDPKIALSDLPCAPATARKILKKFDVKWISPVFAKEVLEKDLLLALKSGVNKKDLAKKFGTTAVYKERASGNTKALLAHSTTQHYNEAKRQQ